MVATEDPQRTGKAADGDDPAPPASVPRVVAHRGASAEAPENTMPAFDLAVELGAGGIEADVRLTADEVPVLHHDETVGRTTDGSGHVGKMTLEELRELDAGAGRGRRFAGTRIPTLDELVEAHAGRVWLDLELKPPLGSAQRLVEAVGEVLDDHGVDEGVFLSSFRPDVLLAAREARPDLPRALIAQEVPEGSPLPEMAPDLDGVGVSRAGMRPGLPDEVHDLGLALLVWTVNDVAPARRLYEQGVDGLITDDPRRILRVSPP